MMSLRDFIGESAEFTSLDMRRLGYHIDQVQKAQAQDTEKNRERQRRLLYQDDKRFQDYKGLKWTEVRARDDMTLKSAILDGIIDSMTDDEIPYAQQEAELYRSGREDDFYSLCSAHKDTIDEILKFLGKYKTGMIKVYRGLILKKIDYEKYIKNSGKPSMALLDKIDNRTKKFNSFSTSPITAFGFMSDGVDKEELVPVMISAMVEPNDVYWAFTAYLMGRHRGCGEYELNINNLKELHDLRIVHDIGKERKAYALSILDVKKIQAQLDATKDPKKVFDKVEKADSFDKTVLDCRLGGFHVLVKNNKMITPFGMYISEVKDDIYAIADTDYVEEFDGKEPHWYLYKEGVGQIGKKYPRINRHVKFVDTENIMVYTDVKNRRMQLVNCVTGKELFNFQAMDIQKAPGNIYSLDKSPWHAEEYYIVKLPNKKYTVVDARGNCVIKTKLRLFDRIDFKINKMEFDGIILPENKRYSFVMKNGAALQKM